MSLPHNTLKQKMLELTSLFSVETTIFERLVLIYKYFRLIDNDPLAKEMLQKIFNDSLEVFGKYDYEIDELGKEFTTVDGKVLETTRFWHYMTNLRIIHRCMEKLYKSDLKDTKLMNDLRNLFSRSYSQETYELSMNIINNEVFEKLSEQKFVHLLDKGSKTFFDDKKSALYVKGHGVQINKQGKITNAHKILHHIFVSNKDNITDEFYFSEIAEDEFGELDYKSRKNNWRTYARACEHVNSKVKKQTDGQITDFLVISSGTTGHVKVNPKYL